MRSHSAKQGMISQWMETRLIGFGVLDFLANYLAFNWISVPYLMSSISFLLFRAIRLKQISLHFRVSFKFNNFFKITIKSNVYFYC